MSTLLGIQLIEKSGFSSAGPKSGVVLIGGALLAMWVLELADLLLLGGALDAYGIRPRSVDGLEGIVLSPVSARRSRPPGEQLRPFRRLRVAGLPQWTAQLRGHDTTLARRRRSRRLLVGAPNTVHIGASGVVFGYLGYLLLRGYFSRSVGAILLSLLLVVLYGGALWGLLPIQTGVSWTAHLFGFLGGGLSAYLLRRRGPRSLRPREA